MCLDDLGVGVSIDEWVFVCVHAHVYQWVGEWGKVWTGEW